MNNYSTPMKEQEKPPLEEGSLSNGEQAESRKQEPGTPAQHNQPFPPMTPTFFGTPQSPSTWPSYYPGTPPPWAAPPSRRSSPWPWFILAMALLFMLVFGGALFVLGGIGLNVAGYTNSVTDTRNFTMATNPTLVLNNDTGSMHVRGLSGSNQIAIQTTRHSGPWGNVNDITVSYTQNSAANTLTVNVSRTNPGGWFNGMGVDFDITVPSTAALQLKTNTGSIDVNGVSGELVLTSNTGSVSASNGAASGHTQLKTNTGSVTFNGSIGTTGTYQFETNTGSINVTLPAESAFHVTAATDTGTITTNFVGVTVQHRQVVGADAQGDVGTSPQAEVSMRTNTGSINLFQR